jgi:hypothetical protein
MRKRLAAGIVALTCLVIAGYVVGVRVTAPERHINRTTCEKIEAGMNEGEVEQLIGLPAGDYTSRQVVVWEGSLRMPVGAELKTWAADEGTILVCFHDDKVVFARFEEPIDINESLVDRLRRWLRL